MLLMASTIIKFNAFQHVRLD